ncbi:LysR substrate-binding domain-containing protein [Micromonospora sp. FIMYZ51]|uniref:LysR substrate-binding domain-containing protein n=1 Tax=Micromonospora sp. FIMYZ51 TaxID=3051832 RepID=UPI00311E745F
MSVDLRLMRYVVTVAEEGSFERAAHRLHMAQPPLSRQIRDLERQLGVPLFTRRPTRLTEAGTAFVASARKVLSDADAMVQATRAAGRGHAGTVRIGTVVSAAHEVVPQLLDALRAAHPDITVRTGEAWPTELEAGLRAGRFDLVLSRGASAQSDLARQTVRREPLVAVVGPRHPFAGRPTAALNDLRIGPINLPPEHLTPGYRAAIFAACARAGVPLDARDCQQLGWRRVGIAEDIGFSLVPRSLAALPTVDGVVLTLTDDLPASDLELMWRGDALPPAAAVVVDVAAQLTRQRGWAG